MKAEIKYFGRVHEWVTYLSVVTLSTPVDVADVTKAKKIAEDALLEKFPGCILEDDAQIHSTFTRCTIEVVAETTVPECTNCGCVGHPAKDCSQV